jgi:hypothetical protein
MKRATRQIIEAANLKISHAFRFPESRYFCRCRRLQGGEKRRFKNHPWLVECGRAKKRVPLVGVVAFEAHFQRRNSRPEEELKEEGRGRSEEGQISRTDDVPSALENGGVGGKNSGCVEIEIGRKKDRLLFELGVGVLSRIRTLLPIDFKSQEKVESCFYFIFVQS